MKEIDKIINKNRSKIKNKVKNYLESKGYNLVFINWEENYNAKEPFVYFTGRSKSGKFDGSTVSDILKEIEKVKNH